MYKVYNVSEDNPWVVTGLTATEKEILEYYNQGKKRKEIATQMGFSYDRVSRLLLSAKIKDKFIKDMHSRGEIWIGEIPGLPCKCVGALQRRGIFTVSELLRMKDYELLKVYNIGPKSIEAIRCYRASLDMKQAGDTNESPDITEEYN